MPAHPLAVDLIERLRDRPHARVLDLGSGHGRNTVALTEAGLTVTPVDDLRAASAQAIGAVGDRFDAVLATHALLHGTPQSVAERIDAIARVLVPGGLFYATFASTHDARYGRGAHVAENTFAAVGGDESGVAHVYYDEHRLRAVLTPYFEIDTLEERRVDHIAGRWAHPTTPLHGAVHWLVRGRKRHPAV